MGGFIFLYSVAGLFVLGAKVEGNHHRDDDHHIIGTDGSTQCQDHKDSDHSQRYNGLNLEQAFLTDLLDFLEQHNL